MSDKTFDALWSHYEARRVRGKKSAPETLRLWNSYIQPHLGGRTVSRTGFKDIDDLHQRYRDTPYQANRVLSLIKTMYAYAQALEWIDQATNPGKLVRMFSEKKRRRHMTAAEAPRISRELMLHESGAPAACLFYWLLIFTGARCGEMQSAKWKNLTGNRLVLQEHKSEDSTGVERVIILPPVAMDKIEQLAEPLSLRHPDKKIIDVSNPQWLWRFVRVRAKCRDLRIHDLRHTFGAYALECGYTLDQIGEALNHSSPATTKIYAELTDRSRRKISLDASLSMLADMGISESPVNPLS